MLKIYLICVSITFSMINLLNITFCMFTNIINSYVTFVNICDRSLLAMYTKVYLPVPALALSHLFNSDNSQLFCVLCSYPRYMTSNSILMLFILMLFLKCMIPGFITKVVTSLYVVCPLVAY